MKKSSLFSVLLFCSYLACAQPYPDLNTYTISPMSVTSFTEAAEVPPWTIPGGWHSYFFVGGKGSCVMSTPVSIIGNSFVDKNAGPNTTSLPFQQDSRCPGDAYGWKRNYYAIYAAEYITHPSAGTVSLGFLHSENRNECINNHVCQNTINPDNSVCWDFLGYNGFLNASWIPNNASTNWGQQYFANEMGPISWPSTGYLQSNGKKATAGLRHPSSIQANGYVYVFYKDSGPYGGVNPNDVEGRHGGIKVVRAPITDCLNPYAYRAYYKDPAGNEFWNPSLPAGFTKENLSAFLAAPGPMASDILNGDGASSDQTRFSVAQVRGANYFIGVEEYRDYQSNTNYIALRFSNDLVNWTPRKRIIYSGASNGGWAGDLHYPIFLSNDGWSNTSVDSNNFWILGTSDAWGKSVNKIQVHYEPPAPPPPPPPPPPICYDDFGRAEYCPVEDAKSGQALNGLAATLDMSSAAAPAVYPNPGRGMYNLSYTLKDQAITQLCVLDVTGRRLQAGPTTMRGPGLVTESVDISSRTKGVYMLELSVNGGKKVFKVI